MATGDNGPTTTTTAPHHGISAQTVTGPLSHMASGIGHGVGRFVPHGVFVGLPFVLLGLAVLVYLMVRRSLKKPAVPRPARPRRQLAGYVGALDGLRVLDEFATVTKKRRGVDP